MNPVSLSLVCSDFKRIVEESWRERKIQILVGVLLGVAVLLSPLGLYPALGVIFILAMGILGQGFFKALPPPAPVATPPGVDFSAQRVCIRKKGLLQALLRKFSIDPTNREMPDREFLVYGILKAAANPKVPARSVAFLLDEFADLDPKSAPIVAEAVLKIAKGRCEKEIARHLPKEGCRARPFVPSSQETRRGNDELEEEPVSDWKHWLVGYLLVSPFVQAFARQIPSQFARLPGSVAEETPSMCPLAGQLGAPEARLFLPSPEDRSRAVVSLQETVASPTCPLVLGAPDERLFLPSPEDRSRAVVSLQEAVASPTCPLVLGAPDERLFLPSPEDRSRAVVSLQEAVASPTCPLVLGAPDERLSLPRPPLPVRQPPIRLNLPPLELREVVGNVSTVLWNAAIWTKGAVETTYRTGVAAYGMTKEAVLIVSEGVRTGYEVTRGLYDTTFKIVSVVGQVCRVGFSLVSGTYRQLGNLWDLRPRWGGSILNWPSHPGCVLPWEACDPTVEWCEPCETVYPT